MGQLPPDIGTGDVHAILLELRRIASLLEAQSRPPAPPQFISGGFRRRAGNIYARVAEPGTPNAGDVDGNNPPRDI
jgi:hypothetical protein